MDGQLQRQFGPIATERQNLWYLWATNDPEGAAFHNKEEHLPLIAYWFRNLWDTTTIDDDTEVEDISQTQLEAVKREIIDALVASFVLDPSVVGIRPTRRSRRISGDGGGADDLRFPPPQIRNASGSVTKQTNLMHSQKQYPIVTKIRAFVNVTANSCLTSTLH